MHSGNGVDLPHVERPADQAEMTVVDGLAGAERAAPAVPRASGRAGLLLRQAIATARPYRVAILVYLATRGLLLGVAILNSATRHHPVLSQLSNWDGLWYGRLAAHGYPAHVVHAQTTLGFFPLYPIVVWLGAHVVYWLTSQSFASAIISAGVVVSMIGGLVATVLVQKLASGWWGDATGRRSALLFCLFPGSVVFSMVYAEGIMIPLAAGTILALERRRWLLAGVLAGLATACEPEAALLVVVCAVSAARELRRRGWRDPAARRSVLAPVFSVVGIGAFAAFLWAWTGSPFANLIAQHDGWREKTELIAFANLVHMLGSEISFTHFNHPTINLNVVVGVAGGIALFAMLALVLKERYRMSLEAILWTLGISLLALTSSYPFSPNPRVLITAFPAVLVVACYVRGRAFYALATASAVALAGMSALTFVGVTLRP
jgi:hypothetical protein